MIKCVACGWITPKVYGGKGRHKAMANFQKDDIEQLLQELGNELAQRFDSPVQILLIGGAYMLLTLYNRETTQDPELGQLTRLQWLDLSGNQLTTISPELDQLSHLQELDL